MFNILFALWLLSTTAITIILWFIIRRTRTSKPTAKVSDPEPSIQAPSVFDSHPVEPIGETKPVDEISLELFLDKKMEEIPVNQKPFLSVGAEFANNTLGYFSGPIVVPDEKDQDRVFGGLINDRWPCVVLADGVTDQKDSGIYAELAVQISVRFLSYYLPKIKEPTEMMSSLENFFQRIHTSPELQKQESGATTLLIVFLWQYGSQVFWFYAYEGNGLINLVSPSRKIQGIEIPSALLSPQKVSKTACLSKEGLSVPPFVGCVKHQDGDLLYVASDGMIVADKWLMKNKEIASRLDVFLLNNWKDPEKIQTTLSECPFTDDAAMGIICTAPKPQ